MGKIEHGLTVLPPSDPRLHEVMPDVTEFTDILRLNVLKMKILMEEYDAVGLAANQVGIDQRVALVSDDNRKIYTCVNLKVLEGWGDRYVPEGCLTLPGIMIVKRRPEVVYASWQNKYGESTHKYAEGLLANTICHEADHLDGRLMTDPDHREWHKNTFHSVIDT